MASIFVMPLLSILISLSCLFFLYAITKLLGLIYIKLISLKLLGHYWSRCVLCHFWFSFLKLGSSWCKSKLLPFLWSNSKPIWLKLHLGIWKIASTCCWEYFSNIPCSFLLNASLQLQGLLVASHHIYPRSLCKFSLIVENDICHYQLHSCRKTPNYYLCLELQSIRNSQTIYMFDNFIVSSSKQ